MFYRFRFAWHLWRNVPGMSFRDAWRYPNDPNGSGDPTEDAEAEMSYMTD